MNDNSLENVTGHCIKLTLIYNDNNLTDLLGWISTTVVPLSLKV